MNLFFENLIIFIFCIALFPFESFGMKFLICILLVFSLICYKIAFPVKKVEKLCNFIFIIAAIFEPAFLLLFPAFAYHDFCKKHFKILIAFAFISFFSLDPADLKNNILYLLLIIISLILAFLRNENDQYEILTHKLRDESVEHELLLKEKNQNLIDKQSDELYIAVLQERNRIAREIHDNVGHMLSRSILQLAAMGAICKDEQLKPHFETLNDSLNEAMNNIRNSVHDLHDEAVSLEDAIHSILSEFTFCKVDFSYQIKTKLPKKIKYCFLAIIKESLNNVMKHSNATEVKLTLKEQSAFYQLIIKDNGSFDSSKLKQSDGIGLKSMKERVKANNGIIHISFEEGMRIFITIPK